MLYLKNPNLESVITLKKYNTNGREEGIVIFNNLFHFEIEKQQELNFFNKPVNFYLIRIYRVILTPESFNKKTHKFIETLETKTFRQATRAISKGLTNNTKNRVNFEINNKQG